MNETAARQVGLNDGVNSAALVRCPPGRVVTENSTRWRCRRSGSPSPDRRLAAGRALPLPGLLVDDRLSNEGER